MKRFITFSILTILLILHSGCSFHDRITKSNKKNFKHAPYDVIIVPGFPYKQEKDSILFHVRMHFAKELYDKGLAKNIIFSGTAAHTHFVEGKIMKTIADSLGIPPSHTFAEVKAEHSNENIINGTKMAKEMGFKKIAVATDPYQFSYMTLLLALYAPRTGILTFYPEQMPDYNKPLPVVDTTASYIKNFTPIE